MSRRRLRIGHEDGRPLAVDLCCGAGGSAMGLWQAGFNIVGVDLHPQPNFPFEFIQGDALGVVAGILGNGMRLPDGRGVDAANSSPPCQRWFS
jgi:DNA (cytosine-5)-methyltransferase 1